MQLINPGQTFSFNYPTYDMNTGLFVRAKVYTVTTGTPVLVANVTMTDITGQGFYSGNFSGADVATYLVICNVYTDGTYAVVDTTRSPSAECFKSLDAPVGLIPLNYGAYDCSPGLYVAANTFEVSGISPVLISKTGMAHVFGGVYFVNFTGVDSKTYEVQKLVYQNSIFTVIDTGRSQGSDALSVFKVGTVISNYFKAARLVGPSNQAILRGE